jgi:hypothetical protein
VKKGCPANVVVHYKSMHLAITHQLVVEAFETNACDKGTCTKKFLIAAQMRNHKTTHAKTKKKRKAAGERSHAEDDNINGDKMECDEARGLDQAPKMLQQLQVYGDKASMHLLEVIERDELTHVSSALRWFKYICAATEPPLETIPKFHSIVRANFRGSLLPPFNTAARTACGFTEEWYLPLAEKKPRPAAAASKADEADAPAAAAPAAAAPAAAAAAAASAAQ